MSETTDELLKVLIRVSARSTMTEDKLRELVATEGRQKQVKAYNLCDGSRTQGEIAKELGIDSGNFSRTVNRWVDLGVLFRIGKEEQLLHLYPLRVGGINAK